MVRKPESWTTHSGQDVPRRIGNDSLSPDGEYWHGGRARATRPKRTDSACANSMPAGVAAGESESPPLCTLSRVRKGLASWIAMTPYY